MVSTLLPMPSMGQPIATSRLQTSCTWGSLAALRRDRRALGQRRGHDAVLGGGDRRLVQEDIAAVQPAAGVQLELAVVVQARAQRLEDLQMGVDAPAADIVAAGGGGHREVASARQQRAHQCQRAANLAEELRRRAPVTDGAGAQRDRVPAPRSSRRGRPGCEHGLHVADRGTLWSVTGSSVSRQAASRATRRSCCRLGGCCR